MITKYDPALLTLSEAETEWLQRVGTQFAVAHYEYKVHEILSRQRQNTVFARAARSLIDSRQEKTAISMSIPSPFESGAEIEVDLFKLEATIDCWEGRERDRLGQELQILEHKGIAVGDVEESNWIDPHPDHAATATLEYHPHLKPFWKPKGKILHGWQKAEAGY